MTWCTMMCEQLIFPLMYETLYISLQYIIILLCNKTQTFPFTFTFTFTQYTVLCLLNSCLYFAHTFYHTIFSIQEKILNHTFHLSMLIKNTIQSVVYNLSSLVCYFFENTIPNKSKLINSLTLFVILICQFGQLVDHRRPEQ